MPHIHELYDFTVGAFIVFDNRVLLVQHPKYDKWLPPGGHIELDEDIEMALHREIREETGLEVEILSKKPNVATDDTKFLPAPNYIDVHEANAPHRHIALNYFCVAKSSDFVLSSEHSAAEWIGLDQLDSEKYGLSESVKFYCQEAIKMASAQ